MAAAHGRVAAGSSIASAAQKVLDADLSLKRRVAHSSRQPQPAVHSLACVVKALQAASKVVVILGAGVSVSSGIPDFRSPNSGLYAKIAAGEFGGTQLSEPQELFDVRVFKEEPELFYSLVSPLLQAFEAAEPSLAHRFVAQLAKAGKLQRVYTQNIDSLEARAGVPAKAIVQCHGSLDKASCVACGASAAMSRVKRAAAAGDVARCRKCKGGAIKPNIVFFYESLPQRFHTCLHEDTGKADCVLVMGSSMSVAPVSTLLQRFPAHTPAFLVNRESLDQVHKKQVDAFDVELLGDADDVCSVLWGSVLGGPAAEGIEVSHSGRKVFFKRIVAAGGGKRQRSPSQAAPSAPAKRAAPSVD